MREKEEIKNKLIELIDFINSSRDDSLMDHVASDLDIVGIDYECSQIYDMIEECKHNASFEDIVKATKDRVLVAIQTFIDELS